MGSISEGQATRDSRGGIVNDPFPTPFPSSGFDLDAEKIKVLSAGGSYIEDVPAAEVQEQVEAGRLNASGDFAALNPDKRARFRLRVSYRVAAPVSEEANHDATEIDRDGR